MRYILLLSLIFSNPLSAMITDEHPIARAIAADNPIKVKELLQQHTITTDQKRQLLTCAKNNVTANEKIVDQMTRDRIANCVIGSTELGIGIAGAYYLFFHPSCQWTNLPELYAKIGCILFTIGNGARSCIRAFNGQEAIDCYTASLAIQKIIEDHRELIEERRINVNIQAHFGLIKHPLLSHPLFDDNVEIETFFDDNGNVIY